MNQIELKALAKINLGLDVLGRRENGYHDVRMVMQSVYLYDEVKIEKTEAPRIALASNLSFLPTGEGNIAYKAAQLLTEEFEIGEGVKITLNKHIPVAAGLAGGSRKLQCSGSLIWDEQDVPSGADAGGIDGKGSPPGCGCPLLYHAGNCARRRDRRGAECTAGNAEMYGADSKTAGERFYKSCLADSKTAGERFYKSCLRSAGCKRDRGTSGY